MNKKAFTLVELIVVITILAILATIGYTSFQWYKVSSRDSVRLSDIKSMEKILDLYEIKKWKYPLPVSPQTVTYSWSLLWSQWSFGTTAYTSNISLSNVPSDPVTWLSYAYSVTNTNREYQLAAVLEGALSFNSINNLYAWTEIAKIYVKWNYNGKIIKVSANGTQYILWIPSIMSADAWEPDILNIIQAKKLVYKWYNNLPYNFTGSIHKVDGWFDYETDNIVLYEWEIRDLATDKSKRIVFLDNLQKSYSGTIIAQEEIIQWVLAIIVNTNNPTPLADNTVANILNNNFWMHIPIVEIAINNDNWAWNSFASCIFWSSIFSTCNL